VDTNLKFSGKAEANADIYLKILADDTTYDYYPDHAVPKGDIAGILKTTADANGDWSVSAEKPNWSYTYKAEVTSVDEAGNTHDYAPTTFYIPMESISVAPTDHLKEKGKPMEWLPISTQGKIKHEIERCFTKANRQDKCQR